MIDEQNLDDNCCPVEASKWAGCRPWSLSTDAINCYANNIVEETLDIGGAIINIHKLLGIHEQDKLIDQAGNGTAISSGDRRGYPASNAFTKYNSYWMSLHSGDTLLREGFIGYDFGEARLENGRLRYSGEVNVRRSIGSIKIKQGYDDKSRAKRIRIERSDDGIKWFGVEILELPNDDKMHTISFKKTVVSRFWRLRPIEFHSTECSAWVVVALELSEFSETRLDNIQDKIWMENRSREYMIDPIEIKMIYQLAQNEMDLTRFGFGPSEIRYHFTASFNSLVRALGRPIVIGDILEVPMEAMYTPTLERQRLYLEVISVSWDTNATVSPGWQFTSLSIIAKPAMASEETQDIFGDLSNSFDISGLAEIDDGNNSNYQDIMGISDNVHNTAKDQVPIRGIDTRSQSRIVTEEDLERADQIGLYQLDKLKTKARSGYVRDAMPPNGNEYTEGPDFPEYPHDKQWHRLTYEGTASKVPVRLYRYSANKLDWIFMERDERSTINNQNVLLDEFVD